MNACLRSLRLVAAAAALTAAASALAEFRPPAVVRAPAPSYPFELRQSGREAAVLVHFHVTPAGTTKEVSVVSSSDPAFEAAALAAARCWTFEPARQDGVAVDCPTIQLVVFHQPGSSATQVRARLADSLQTRLGCPGGVRHLVRADGACICGSGRSYDDCHRRAF